MNPIILPPAMGKIVGRTGFFSLGEATSLGERMLWIQNLLNSASKTDLVSNPARVEGLVNTVSLAE